MANTINCPVCGKLTDARLDSCPHCGTLLRRKRPQGVAQAVQAQKICPYCKSPIGDDDFICMTCNTNLLTGQKVAEEVAASRRRRASTGWMVFGGIAAVVIIGLGLFGLYVASSDPVSKAVKLIEEREYTEAQTILAAYVERVPDDARAFYELGRLQWRVSQFARAAESFTRAVRIDPDNVDAAMWAVVALSRAGVPGAQTRQIEFLERVVQYRVADRWLWYVLALTRGTAGDVPGQIEALERVIQLRPMDDSAMYDSARWGMGLGHALRGEFEEARGQLRLVGEGPRFADVLAVQGFVASLEGKPVVAAQRLEQALETDGITVASQAMTELGKLRMKEGLFLDAQTHFDSALALRQNDPYIRYLRALCLQARARGQDALTEFESIARDRGAFAMEATVQVAQVYLSMDMPDRARKALEQAGKLGGSGAAYSTVQGRILALGGDEAGAVNAFRRAIDSDPAYAGAYLERGLLHVKNEDLGNGLRDLERYLQLVGSNVQGTRAADIRALTEQLRQATQGGGTSRAARSVTRTGVNSL